MITAGSCEGKLPAGSSASDSTVSIACQAAWRCSLVIWGQFRGGQVIVWTGSGMLTDPLAQSLRPGHREGQLPVLSKSKAAALADLSTGWAAVNESLKGRGAGAKGARGMVSEEGAGVTAGQYSICSSNLLRAGDGAWVPGTSWTFSCGLGVSDSGLLEADESLCGSGEVSPAGSNPAVPNSSSLTVAVFGRANFLWHSGWNLDDTMSLNESPIFSASASVTSRSVTGSASPRTGLFEVWRVRFASSWTRYAIDSLHAVCLPQMCPSQTRRYGRGLQYWSDGLPTAPSHLPPKVLLLCRSWGACVPRRSQRLCQLEFWLLVGTTMLDRLWARGQTKCNTPLMLATSVFGRIHRRPCYVMAQLKSRLNIPWPNDAECMGHVWCHLLCWYPLFCDVESLAGYVRG